MKHTVFTGSGVAVITPMFPDGSIHFEELDRILEDQIAKGTDCIVTCGTTGEAATFHNQEHLQVIAHTVQKVNGRVPVVAGTGSNDTAHAIALSKEAKALGVDGLLHVTPYYNKTSQKGLIKHFTAIADATDLPVIVYNVPSRTGVNIQPKTYLELSKHPNIVATKEANGDLSSVLETRYLCGDDLDVYSGNDDQIVSILSLGGKGVISVLANVMPRETHNICQLYFQGNVQESAALQTKLMPLIRALFSDVNPIPVKEAMNQMGYQAGPCRLPLTEMGEEAKKALVRQLAAFHLMK